MTALQPVGFRSSHVIPTRASALAGIYGCVITCFGCLGVTALQPDAVPQHLGHRQKQRFRKEMLIFLVSSQFFLRKFAPKDNNYGRYSFFGKTLSYWDTDIF